MHDLKRTLAGSHSQFVCGITFLVRRLAHPARRQRWTINDAFPSAFPFAGIIQQPNVPWRATSRQRKVFCDVWRSAGGGSQLISSPLGEVVSHVLREHRVDVGAFIRTVLCRGSSQRIGLKHIIAYSRNRWVWCSAARTRRRTSFQNGRAHFSPNIV